MSDLPPQPPEEQPADAPDQDAPEQEAPEQDTQAPTPGDQSAAATTTRPKPTGMKRKKKKEKKRYDSMSSYLWHEWIKPLGLILLILGSFRIALLDWNDVPSGSMEPSVLTGDRIGVDKRAYGLHVPFTKDVWIGSRWGRPYRGYIVVAYSPDPKDPVRIVKRVVGVPGDTVEVRDGRLILNGEPVEYREADPQTAGRYLSTARRTLAEFYEEMLPTDAPGDDDGFKPHYVRFVETQPKNRSMDQITLGDDEYFFMGDNRDESKDGRSYGRTPGDRIVGRAIGVAFSLDHDNFFVPRFTRFLNGLR